jgi:hypothetical protein
VELLDPVRGVRRHELTNRRGVVVEVDRLSPFGRVPRREVSGRVPAEVVAVGSEVVVDDVEDDAETEAMGAIDESAEVVGRAVEM